MPNLFRHPTGRSACLVYVYTLYLLYDRHIIQIGYVYIMSNQYRTTFYIGVTSNLEGRVWEHVNNKGSAFVKRYKLFDLVYYEYF